MKRFLAILLLGAAALLQAPAHAQGRFDSQPELDALLAPVALYPDPVLSDLLVAATFPDDLHAAAAWSRANPQLSGQDALRAAEPMLWQPSVKALLAFPELLARMDESPQWTADLGAAFISQEPQVMESVQSLRRRAQASGALQSDSQQQVVQEGASIAVYPAQPQVIYVPYYDPYVVYGPWWWPAYRPVYWRPWQPRPVVFVSASFFGTRVDWHRRHVTYVDPRPVVVHRVQAVNVYNHPHPAPRPMIRHEAPRPAFVPNRPVVVPNHIQNTQATRPLAQQRAPEHRAGGERRGQPEHRGDQRG